MASLTPGFSGADVKNICNEAAIGAARRESETVEMIDFEVAAERVMAGLSKENNLMSNKEKRTIAIHESGHAVAGWFLPKAEPLLKVSIVPRSNGALGFAQYLPQETGLYSKTKLLDRMAVTLGGRAAEDAFIGSITTGASDDLKKVTQTAYSMVGNWGMEPEKIGLFNFTKGEGLSHRLYSEGMQERID
jgi:AFG3 family protein